MKSSDIKKENKEETNNGPAKKQKKVSFSETELNVHVDNNNNEETPALYEGDKMVQDCIHGQTKTFSEDCSICILFKLNEKLDKMAKERSEKALINENDSQEIL